MGDCGTSYCPWQCEPTPPAIYSNEPPAIGSVSLENLNSYIKLNVALWPAWSRPVALPLLPHYLPYFSHSCLPKWDTQMKYCCIGFCLTLFTKALEWQKTNLAGTKWKRILEAWDEVENMSKLGAIESWGTDQGIWTIPIAIQLQTDCMILFTYLKNITLITLWVIIVFLFYCYQY